MSGRNLSRADVDPTAHRQPALLRSERGQFWLCLALFAVLAWAIRFYAALKWFSIERPDETFQSLEPAHRLWTGWGVVTWEWRDGIRSWVFPDVLAEIMRASAWLGLPRSAAIPLVWALLSAVAAAGAVVAVAMGWRLSKLIGATICGVLVTFWPDLVYYGPKTLLEVQAGNVLVVAAGLASMAPLPGMRGRAPVFGLVGALLGLAFGLRFQLAPALGILALGAARLDVRRAWLPLLVGAAIVVGVFGLSDYLAWGSPFQSIWKNIQVNLFQAKSNEYGVSPVYRYLVEIAQLEGAAALPIALFFVLGARLAPLLALTAVVVVLEHSVIAHKEISFVYAALPMAMIVVGLGTAQALCDLPRWLRVPIRPGVALAVALFAWLGAAVLTSIPANLRRTNGTATGLASLLGDARRQEDLCGLGLFEEYFPWWLTGGYSTLDRAVPVYLVRKFSDVPAASPGFNYLITANRQPYWPEGYQLLRCTQGYCLLKREHECRPVPDFEINRVLEQSGQ